MILSDILTVYFSRADENYFPGGLRNITVGNTRKAAEKARALAGGGLFQIKRAQPYPASYSGCVAESRKELAENARPELASWPEAVGGPGTLILCYPCWCGTMPMPVFTFLEKYGFSGWTVLPLCTNEGSGMGGSEADIRRLCPGAEVKPGLSVLGSRADSAEGEIASWLKKYLPE